MKYVEIAADSTYLDEIVGFSKLMSCTYKLTYIINITCIYRFGLRRSMVSAGHWLFGECIHY